MCKRESCVVNKNVEEVVKREVALSNYADKYIQENDILEECVCDEDGGLDYVDKVIIMRERIKSSRMRDYIDYPELMEDDYSITV